MINVDIQAQSRLSQLEKEKRAYQELTPHLVSCFRTSWKNLTSRDFYGRLYDKVDGCKLCSAEAQREENGSKSFTHNKGCPLIVLGIVEAGTTVFVDW